MSRISAAAAAAWLLAGAACSESPMPVAVREIEVAAREIAVAASVDVARGDTSRHVVTVYDSTGGVIRRPSLTVTSSNAAIASAKMADDTTLLLVGHAAGRTDVTITALGTRRSVVVAVVETARPLQPTSLTVTLRTTGRIYRGQRLVAVATLRHDSTVLTPVEPYEWASNNPGVGRLVHAAGDSAVFDAATIGSFWISARPVSWERHRFAASPGITVYNYTPATTPQQVAGPQQWQEIAAIGTNTCGIAAGGDVYCWGTAPTGKVVDQRFTPQRQDVLSPAIRLSIAVPHVCVISTSDGLRCGGTAEEIGTNAGWPKSMYGAQALLKAATATATGGLHGCVLDASQAAWCWGNDEWGQTGVADPPSEACMATGRLYLCYYSPQQVTTTARFTQLVAGNLFTCGLATDGLTYCWGGATTGQPLATTCPFYPGHGPKPEPPHYCNPVPVAIPGTSEAPHAPPRFASLAASGGRACGITGAGDSFCWDGQNRLPERVGMGHSYAAIAPGNAHTCGVTTAGTVVCWGRGAEGQLGRALPASDAPVEVALPATARAVASGANHSCAILATDALYCWGASDVGQLGVGPGVPPGG